MQEINNEETLLTALCAICHVNPLKYTCPRCGIHTCSLPCVKRHKQWAQCSGVRDPAEYRKRSELATASSIDKDFNFITNVERSLQKADDIVSDRGLDLKPARVRPLDQKSKIEQELAGRDITIIRAPKGLSRSKQNKTQWTASAKCITWTVEWVRPDGFKSCGNVPETLTVRQAYVLSTEKRHGHNKRKRQQKEDDDGTHKDSKTTECKENSSHATLLSDTGTSKSRNIDSSDMPDATTALSQVNTQPTYESTSQQLLSPTAEIQDSRSKVHFYLHRPNTEARFKCVIPLEPDATVSSVVNHRTILEFPTVFVRHESPAELGDPFILEENYNERYGSDIPINISAPIPTAEGRVDETLLLEDGEVTSESIVSHDLKEKVLEVLAKDLGD